MLTSAQALFESLLKSLLLLLSTRLLIRFKPSPLLGLFLVDRTYRTETCLGLLRINLVAMLIRPLVLAL